MIYCSVLTNGNDIALMSRLVRVQNEYWQASDLAWVPADIEVCPILSKEMLLSVFADISIKNFSDILC